MANIEYTRTFATPAGLFGSVVGKFTAAFEAWRAQRATHIALAQLTDRELEDIGLSRGDIERVARNA